MYVDVRDTGSPRRGGGLEKMVSIADSGQDEGSDRTTADFADALGVADQEFAAELLSASGGDLVLGRTAVEAAAGADFAVDLSSRSFADYVASLAPAPALELSTADVWVARVLAHLSSFTEQTALLALTSVPAGVETELWDAEGVLMRLRMAGVIVADGESGGRRYLRVPSLLAAAYRRDVAPTAEEGLISRLVAVLNDHLEGAEAVEPAILSDVLTLARRAGLWHDLVRLSESIGLPMFLLTPASACMAFAGLPAEALRAEPELGLLSRLAEDVLGRLGGGVGEGTIREEELREAVAAETRQGRMRELFVSSGTAGGVRPDGEAESREARADGHAAPESEAAGPLETIRAIAELAAAGRHAEAVELGLSTRVRPGARRAQLTIRLFTAISAVHDSRLSKALSILHDVEGQASVRHVDGDFLLPAALAWSALAAATGADHERADRLLARLAGQPPTLVDDMVHPAWSAAAAVRALDRLDLEGARRSIDDLAAAPQGWGLQAIVPVFGRILAVLSATTESALLFANDEVETHGEFPIPSETEKDLLCASRSLIFIALGQLRWAEVELDQMSADSAIRVVQSVRVELVAGRVESAIALADTWFYHRMLTPSGRADLAALKAAALSRLGRDAEAVAELRTAIGLSAWVSSLLPLALLPWHDRIRLLDLSADDPAWDGALETFSGDFATRDALFARLREVGTITVSETSMPQLSDPETRLLTLLASGLTIAEISTELHQVPGTVKNRLSALYRKFGVSSRAEVVARASSLGFVTPS
ncbi:helix-turn-helix transcriptional regulator [Brevibacterium casei]|uniref:helix-turn-helix transcriptional regulator n=2 Tax=Brevibacterium casei TaxID=33889 RepID=UPI0021B61350|nr:helix-turn-helix transcriptional regulator [Brevibacterium casei]